MKILALGDAFGEAAADYLVGNLRRIQQAHRLDFKDGGRSRKNFSRQAAMC